MVNSGDFIKSVVSCEVTKGKKMIIYGDNELAKSVQSEMKLNIDYYVDDVVVDEDKYVRNVYDLAYEKPGTFFVIVIQPNCGRYHIFKVLTSIGLIEMTDYCMWAYVIDYKYDLKYFSPFLRDVYLGFNRMYFEYNNKYPGFKVFGNPDSKALRIVTLGGSTTDPIHAGIASWPELLYHLLKKLKIECVIFNGGFASYTSSNELIKFIRDVMPLKPDIVISYSGINDIGCVPDNESDSRYKRPFIDKSQDNIFKWISQQEGGATTIYGMQTDTNVMQYWLDNHKLMHSMCNAFNINHISILQAISYSDGIPSIFVDKHGDMNLRLVDSENYEKRQGQNYVKERYAYMESNLEEYNYILNFHHIFDGLEDYDVYVDSCHVYERGNEIIAANVYEGLLKRGVFS